METDSLLFHKRLVEMDNESKGIKIPIQLQESKFKMQSSNSSSNTNLDSI